MIGIVIASHALVATALLTAAESVLGPSENIIALSIDPTDDAATIQSKFKEAVKSVSHNGGVMILTDMFGGTPANIGLTLHDGSKVELLTGVNLPMVIKAAQISKTDHTLAEAALAVKNIGINSITIASELLAVPGKRNN